MRFSITLLSLLVATGAFSQKMPSDYFEEAESYFGDKKYDQALLSYQYIVNHHPKNKLFAKSYFNAGLVLFNQKKHSQALQIFRSILSGQFDEKENSGGGIMADPYTNYRHRATSLLSDIYFMQQQYDSALHYFSLSDTTYPYLHFCGNEYAANDVYKSIRYATIYQQLKQPEQAIRKLLPVVFISLADNSEVIELLKQQLSRKTGLKAALDSALQQVYHKKVEENNYVYNNYYIRFLDVEIAIPEESWATDADVFNKEKAIKAIEETDFYKMIASLTP